jgi:NADH-quinone oxidoreductase subunit H
MAMGLLYIFVFPGFLFLFLFGFAVEFYDRRLYARFQNRMGPPWFQPVADFIKLSSKEELVPEDADTRLFKLMPAVALTAATASLLYVPLWNSHPLFRFEGDVVVVLYLLTIPTLTYFLGGWFSRSVYSAIGAVRALTQLFAYEVPLFLSILSPMLLADTWSLSGMAGFFQKHPGYLAFNVLGFAIAVVSLLGKLEKTPFDIPEAETEIVAGSFTEYSGRFFAFFRATMNVEMIVGASLLAAVFLPFGFGLNPVLGFVLYLVKVLFIVGLMSLVRTVVARLRIDQMVQFCWKIVAPLAILQILISLVAKEVLHP